MPYRSVEFRAGEHYHVYNRGIDQGPIFFEGENFVFFLRKWREYLHQTADALAYCLMPNHYHFLVRLLTDELSDAMQSFSQSYAKAINLRRKRTGPLFQGRFQAIHVDEDAYLRHLTRYIHLNPVAAGLVSYPEDWTWSSYREYVRYREGTLPNVQTVLQEFVASSLSTDPNRHSCPADDAGLWWLARSRYQAFVEAGIGKDDRCIRRWTIDHPKCHGS